MAEIGAEVLLRIVRACGESEPLYPAPFAAQAGIDRDTLDQALDHLRMHDLVRLTDWVRDKGQGYALTDDGRRVLEQESLLARILAGKPVRPVATSEPRPTFSSWERGEAVRDAFLRPAAPVVTMTLVFVNVLVFVGGLQLAWMQGIHLNTYLSGNLAERMLWNRDQRLAVDQEALGQRVRLYRLQDTMGSLNPRAILGQDQWWRLITHGFLHGGLLHLLFNCIGLYMLGPLVEAMWGRWRFAVVYGVSLLTGGCACVLALQPAVGASGAISGVLTSLFAWVWLHQGSMPRQLYARLMSSIVMNLVFLAYFSFLPGVSWQGHLGGAVGGLLVSFPLNVNRFSVGWRRWAGALGVVLVPLASLAAVLLVHGDLRATLRAEAKWIDSYAKLRPAFAQFEKDALAVYEKDLRPLLKEKKSFKDAADLQRRYPQAIMAFDQVLESLQAPRKQFSETAVVGEEEFDGALQDARGYIESWIELFNRAKVYCQSPNLKNRRSLSEHHQQLLETIAGLQGHALFPSNLRLVSQKENEEQ